jgi:hypothetical protein
MACVSLNTHKQTRGVRGHVTNVRRTFELLTETPVLAILWREKTLVLVCLRTLVFVFRCQVQGFRTHKTKTAGEYMNYRVWTLKTAGLHQLQQTNLWF